MCCFVTSCRSALMLSVVFFCFFFCFFLVFPLLGLRVSPFTLWVPTLHTEGLQQSEVSSVQPASLRLRWVYVSAISVCFRTPRLSLGHPGSLTSMHDLKYMRTQIAPLFNVPCGIEINN